jgi:hypothetical protein
MGITIFAGMTVTWNEMADIEGELRGASHKDVEAEKIRALSAVAIKIANAGLTARAREIFQEALQIVSPLPVGIEKAQLVEQIRRDQQEAGIRV